MLPGASNPTRPITPPGWPPAGPAFDRVAPLKSARGAQRIPRGSRRHPLVSVVGGGVRGRRGRHRPGNRADHGGHADVGSVEYPRSHHGGAISDHPRDHPRHHHGVGGGPVDPDQRTEHHLRQHDAAIDDGHQPGRFELEHGDQFRIQHVPVRNDSWRRAQHPTEATEAQRDANPPPALPGQLAVASVLIRSTRPVS
jgi:hypothetical protein